MNSLSISLKIAIVIISSNFLSGCYLWPNSERVAPKISGILLEDDAPVFPAVIILESEGKTKTTNIRKDGSFKFSSTRRYSAYKTIWDRQNFGKSWQLKLRRNNTTRKIYTDTYLDIEFKSEGSYTNDVVVLCELTNPNGASCTKS